MFTDPLKAVALGAAIAATVIVLWFLLVRPQLTFTTRPHAGEVMMLKPLSPRATPGKLAARDVLYFHGDAF